MYVPSAFAEQRIDVLHDFMTAHGFATLVTNGSRGLMASHAPVVVLPNHGERGALQFHLARPNEQWEDLAAGADVMAVFHGPHAYVSPSWYVSKTTNVPTWNYVAVHAYGRPRVMSDDELRDHLDALVAQHESTRPNGWSTAALPADLMEKLRRAVVGFEMSITRLDGKWKLGQNRTRADRLGAIDGLRQDGNHESRTLADWMAATLDGDADRA